MNIPTNTTVRALVIQSLFFSMLVSVHAQSLPGTVSEENDSTSNRSPRSSFLETVFPGMVQSRQKESDSKKRADSKKSTDTSVATTSVPATKGSSVYEEIQSSLRANQQTKATTTSAAAVKNTDTPATGQKDVAASPEKDVKDSVVLVKEKRNLIYAMTGSLLPTDEYIKSGFNPVVTYGLYTLSLLLAVSGLMLLMKKPEFLATKVESVFNFE
jgi:hypothetical protein